MKKVFVIAFLVVGLTTFAQEGKPAAKKAEIQKMTPQEKSELRLKRITAILNLNEKQQKEIAPILEEQQQKREQIVAEFKAMKEKGTKPTEEERAARIKQRSDDQKAMREKLQKILTPEQLSKWDAMVERNKEKRMEKKREMQKEE